MSTESYVIQTDGLGKTYGEVKALNMLNLKVPRNSIFAFLGPNGAGKTTTIKLLLGLAKPTMGNATVLGRDIMTHNDEIRRNVGYLAQHPIYGPLGPWGLVMYSVGLTSGEAYSVYPIYITLVILIVLAALAVVRFRRHEF